MLRNDTGKSSYLLPSCRLWCRLLPPRPWPTSQWSRWGKNWGKENGQLFRSSARLAGLLGRFILRGRIGLFFASNVTTGCFSAWLIGRLLCSLSSCSYLNVPLNANWFLFFPLRWTISDVCLWAIMQPVCVLSYAHAPVKGLEESCVGVFVDIVDSVIAVLSLSLFVYRTFIFTRGVGCSDRCICCVPHVMNTRGRFVTIIMHLCEHSCTKICVHS